MPTVSVPIKGGTENQEMLVVTRETSYVLSRQLRGWCQSLGNKKNILLRLKGNTSDRRKRLPQDGGQDEKKNHLCLSHSFSDNIQQLLLYLASGLRYCPSLLRL